MKTLATVLATPLSVLLLVFLFVLHFQFAVFGRRKPRRFLPQLRPDRVFQALTCDQPAAVSVFTLRPDRVFSDHSRDPTAPVHYTGAL